MTSLHETFTSALHNCARSWRNALDKRLKSLGLSQAAWMTIAMVAKTKGSMSQIELAGKLGVEGPTLVSMLDRLVKQELILREPCEIDRRVKKVILTDKGLSVYKALRKEADAFRNELLKGLDDKDIEIASSLLNRINHKIDSQ